jgi:small subunit ribosomal protein S4e
MGRKGPTRHLKRHQSPPHWPIHRKAGVWTKRTKPGPHSLSTSIPTAILIRDQFQYAKSASEVKKILIKRKLLVDGKPRVKTAYPVGLMDVISIPDTGEIFRVLPDHGGKLKFQQISQEEAQFKLCQIVGKTTQRGGKTQLNLHDGSNIVIKSEQDQYKVNDVLKIKIPEKEILDFVEFKDMQQVIITGGRSQGAKGTLIEIGSEPGWKKTATIRTPEGNDVRTLAKYVFVVGSNTPIINLGDEVEEE